MSPLYLLDRLCLANPLTLETHLFPQFVIPLDNMHRVECGIESCARRRPDWGPCHRDTMIRKRIFYRPFGFLVGQGSVSYSSCICLFQSFDIHSTYSHDLAPLHLYCTLLSALALTCVSGFVLCSNSFLVQKSWGLGHWFVCLLIYLELRLEYLGYDHRFKYKCHVSHTCNQ